MKNNNLPTLKIVPFDNSGISELQSISETDVVNHELILDYPTVYIINTTHSPKVKIYVGETTDIIQRTIQHLHSDPVAQQKWDNLVAEKDSRMIVIGHNHFNKSLTLDIENRLIDYLLGSNAIELINGRGNPQGRYYPSDERDSIFHSIWKKLHEFDSIIFPQESIIKDSALFKASPLKELTSSQEFARRKIINRVATALSKPETGQLIIVEGQAGAGKTVLLSRLFYELSTSMHSNGRIEDSQTFSDKVNGYLLVNHDEQVTIYQNLMLKLGITKSLKDKHVSKPTTFILNTTADNPVDVVLIDESHLLWTQGKQTYRGKNQLNDILKRAKVVIAVLDINQVLAGNEYISPEQIDVLHAKAAANDNLIRLHEQMRVHADLPTLNWLNVFIHENKIQPIPKNDALGFDLKIFDSAPKMYAEIKRKAIDERQGISRMLATFDWPFTQKGKNGTNDFWYVTTEDGFNLPWNKQLKPAKDTKLIKRLSWAEQPQTINEVGSTFTIQGSDLNYAGVILGPSVQYRNGRIVHDVTKSENKNVKNRRSLDNGTKIDLSTMLLNNEMNVLLSRGVHGLYIYAVDPQLRAALLNAQASNSSFESLFTPTLMASEQKSEDYK